MAPAPGGGTGTALASSRTDRRRTRAVAGTAAECESGRPRRWPRRRPTLAALGVSTISTPPGASTRAASLNTWTTAVNGRCSTTWNNVRAPMLRSGWFSRNERRFSSRTSIPASLACTDHGRVVVDPVARRCRGSPSALPTRHDRRRGPPAGTGHVRGAPRRADRRADGPRPRTILPGTGSPMPGTARNRSLAEPEAHQLVPHGQLRFEPSPRKEGVRVLGHELDELAVVDDLLQGLDLGGEAIDAVIEPPYRRDAVHQRVAARAGCYAHPNPTGHGAQPLRVHRSVALPDDGAGPWIPSTSIERRCLGTRPGADGHRRGGRRRPSDSGPAAAERPGSPTAASSSTGSCWSVSCAKSSRSATRTRRSASCGPC